MGTDYVYATLTEDYRLTLTIVGTLDLGLIHGLKTHVGKFVDRGLSLVEIDMSSTDCVTSAGISGLAHIWERCSSAGVKVSFVNVPQGIERLFVVTGVHEIFLGAGSPTKRPASC